HHYYLDGRREHVQDRRMPVGERLFCFLPYIGRCSEVFPLLFVHRLWHISN
ncbi:hypothetical protein ACJX0J_016365, partial [Zea mays]